MRIPLALLFFTLACATPLIGEELFVAPHGQDTASGSTTDPLKTIGAAAKRAQPGDTVTIRAGTYRETVVPAHSGDEGRPITYRGAPGETVVIDGSDPVEGWQSGADGIDRAPMPGTWFSRATPGDGVHLYDPAVHNQADHVFVDGRMMVLARWPNTDLDPSFPTKAVATKFLGKTRDQATNWTTGKFEDAKFNLTKAQAVGAQIMIQPNHGAWSWLLTGLVSGVDGHQFTFRSRSDGGKDFSQILMDDHSRYVVFDKRELLDAPGEWFHDKKTGVLYLKSPDGRPLAGRVTAKRREYAFNLTDLSHLVIRDLTVQACTITTDHDAGGDNVPYDDKGVIRYPWRNAANGLPKEPWHQLAAYRDAPSRNVVLDNLDLRYLSHFTDVSGHFFCQWGQSSGIVLSGRQHRITNCRIRWSAGNGITLLGRDHRALGNLIEDTGYAATDATAIHTGCTERISSDHEIAWNTIRRTGRSAMLPRYMYRSEASGDSDWKARIHHNDISAFGIQDWDVAGIYCAGPGRFIRIDHNHIHDAWEHVDGLGQGNFTAGGIYPDYASEWVIDHNVIWNVEWGIHLQNQGDKSKPAAFLVFNNTVSVRMLGGQPSQHGPYGVVRNSDAPNQESRIEDNVLVCLDGSARWKPVDFEGDPAVQRVVANNVSGTSLEGLGLVGGTSFPEGFVPTAAASDIVGKSGARNIPRAAGLPVPPIDTSPDRGAFAVGVPPWSAGHDAWPGRPGAPSVTVIVEQTPPLPAPEHEPKIIPVAVATAVAEDTARPAPVSPATPALSADPAAPGANTSGPSMLVLALSVAAVGLLLLVILLATKKPLKTTTRRSRR